MPAIQSLMVSYVAGGTDLGSESAQAESIGTVNATATATITFNTNGTVSFSGNGGTLTNSAPATNWNTGGGTYVSCEVISQLGSGSFGVVGSTMYGENRHLMSSGALDLTASATATLGESFSESSEITIKLSVWNAASGGSRTAFGIFSVSATATVTG